MSPRTLTDFAADRLIRRDVTWIKTAELYLWRDRFGEDPTVSSVFLSDATRYLPAATVVDPLLATGPLADDGEGWTTPAGWEGLTVVTLGGRLQLQATSLNAGGGVNGGNLEAVGTTEQFGAVTILMWQLLDAASRWGGVVLGAASDGSSYYACLAEETAAGAYVTTIARYAAGSRVDLIQVPTPPGSWLNQRLYAETRAVATGLQITVRCQGPAGPIFAQAVDPTPLTGTWAGPTIFVATGNPNQVRLGAPIMVGASRRPYLGAVLRWGQMGDAVEALQPASAATSVDLEVSDAVPILATEIAPSAGTVRTYDRLSAMVNQHGVDGFDIGASGLFIRWVPDGGILGASNARLDRPLQSADDVLAYVGAFDTWQVTDHDVITLPSVSAEGGVTRVPVRQAAVAPAPVGLVSPIDWRNGFEEGSIVAHSGVDQSSVWSAVTNFGGGLSIVSGIHGASQSACQFAANGASGGSMLGGSVSKVFDPHGDGTTVYGKGMYHAVTVPSTSTTGTALELVRVTTTGAHACRIFWTTGNRYRLMNVGAGTSVDSLYGMGTLDRLEWSVTRGVAGVGGSVELRIYAGDSRVPREPPLVLPGDPGGSIIGMLWMGLPYGATEVSGSYTLDDVGLSDQGWMGPGCNILAVPNAPVLTQWTPSAGTNVACINDHPGALNDGTYITATTVGLTDQYTWTIPAAGAVPDGALFYRATIYLRGFTNGPTYQVLPIIWDELGNVAGGLPWALDSGGAPGVILNPAAQQYTVFAPAGRSLAQLQHWNLGVQRLSTTGGTLNITVLYGLLEYITG